MLDNFKDLDRAFAFKDKLINNKIKNIVKGSLVEIDKTIPEEYLEFYRYDVEITNSNKRIISSWNHISSKPFILLETEYKIFDSEIIKCSKVLVGNKIYLIPSYLLDGSRYEK